MYKESSMATLKIFGIKITIRNKYNWKYKLSLPSLRSGIFKEIYD